jgi:hypothetical protein
MPELSPAAIAVDDALAACIQLQGEMIRARPLAAAALRAAVAHTQQHRGFDVWGCDAEVWECDADKLLAIADELEAQ